MSHTSLGGRRPIPASLVLLALLLTGCAGQPEPQGPVTLTELFGADVRPRDRGTFGLDRWEALDPHEEVPGPAFRVAYPAGSASPSAEREYGVPGGGMQVYLPRRSGALEQAHLRYFLRFPEGFAFVKGGKLPGLYGGTRVSGGQEPDGTDGFSTRLMWRRDGEGEVYLYAAGRSGDSLGPGEWVWPVGQWVCVEQQVVLNEPGDDNGAVTVWLDGQQVFSEDRLRYRTAGDLRVEGIFFSTFYGGDDPSWAPPTDQHADFAGFRLATDRIGCDG